MNVFANRLSRRRDSPASRPGTGAKIPGSPTRIAKPGSEKELFQCKVNILLNNQDAFDEFKKRMVETNTFSNTGALNLLYLFVEEIELPELEEKTDNGLLGFGLLSSIRRTTDPLQVEAVSPKSEFVPSSSSICKSEHEQHHSPTNTATPTLTPTSPLSTSNTPPVVSSLSSSSTLDKRVEATQLPVCLEQPSLLE